jgi:hypothetical protein
MRRLAPVLSKVGVVACIVTGCGDALTIAIGDGPTDGTSDGGSDANITDAGPPQKTGDPGASCTHRGCGATFHAAVPNFDVSALPQRRVTFCVNATCYSIEVSFLGGPPQSGIGLPVRTASGSLVSSEVLAAFWWDSPRAGSTCTGSILTLYYRTPFASAQDGDRYTLTVDGADGGDAAAPLEFQATATYAITYPNGLECGPACKQVAVGCLD